jgi:hypothetical protein
LSLSTELLGAWRLVSREDRGADGQRRVDPSLGANPVALRIYYDWAGNFAVQFMKRDRSSQAEPAPARAVTNNSHAGGGHDAYFGSYSVDDTTSTLTQRLVGALAPGDVGKVVTRALRIARGRLAINLETTTAHGEPVVRRLEWERA